MNMMGWRLRAERRNVCRFGCCTRTRAHMDRKAKMDRAREKEMWRRDLRNA